MGFLGERIWARGAKVSNFTKSFRVGNKRICAAVLHNLGMGLPKSAH